MKLIKNEGDRADVQFSIDELLTLNNSLNEVCNGIEVIDFDPKIGVTREQAKLLLNSVNKLAREMRPPRCIIENLQARLKQPRSSSTTIRKKCILETSGYQVSFFIKSFDARKDSVAIGVRMTVDPVIEGVAVRSSATAMRILTLQNLILYLEAHIEDLKSDPKKTSDLLYYDIFRIQALSGNVTSESEGSFTLRFMVNTGVPVDRKNSSNFVSAEAVVTFANMHSFTASLQAVVDEVSLL